MKKRFFSIFLALALCVTLLPAAVLADGDGQARADQLYRVNTCTGKSDGTVQGTPETTFAVDATGSPAPLFAIKNSGDGYTVITGGENSGWSVQYKSTDGTVTKTLAWESEDDWEGWRWESTGQLPGSTGKLIATKDSISYSMDVTIGAAEVGVYTSKDANVDAPGTAYVTLERGNYTVDASSVKTVYVKPGYNYVTIDSSTAPSSSNSKVTCTLEGGVLAITNTSGTAQSAIIKCWVKHGSNEPDRWEYTIRFASATQLYRANTDGAGVIGDTNIEFAPNADGGELLPLVIRDSSSDIGYAFITKADGWSVSYYVGDNKVDDLEWETIDGLEGWRWEPAGQAPGDTGTLIARKTGDTVSYTLPVTIGAASFGVFTRKDADVTKGTYYVLPDEDGINTVDASLVTAVYVKPGYDYVTVDSSTAPSSSNSKVTCTLENGVLAITNTSGTAQTATIEFWVKYGNNEPVQWERTIRFASATQLYWTDTNDAGVVRSTYIEFAPDADSGRLLPLVIRDSSSDSGYAFITKADGWSVSYYVGDTKVDDLEWETIDGLEGWCWEPAGQAPGDTGTLIARKTGDTVSYTLPVTIGAAEFGVFTRKDADVTKGTYYVLPGDESGNPAVDASSVKTVYVKPGYDYITILPDSTATPISSSNSKVTCTLEDGVLAITNTSGTAQTAVIQLYWSDGNGDVLDWWYSIDFMLPSRDMTDSDYITGIDAPTAVEFTYKGMRYYMGPRFSGKLTPGGGAMNFVLAEGEYGEIRYDIGFWTRVGDEYYLVTDETLLKELVDAFDGTLKLTAYALRSDDTATPEKYPAIYSREGIAYPRENIAYPCSIWMKAGLENQATWVFVATGTVNGTTLAAASTQEWKPFKGIYYTPDLTKDAAGKIADVNAFLAGLTAEDNTTIQISLPEGTYEGYIVVPDWDKRVNVEICGELSGSEIELRSSENKLTHLYGGIYSTSKTVAVSAGSIFFHGNGRDKTASAYTGYSNYAIYGGSHGSAGDCVFWYYDIAVYGGNCDGSNLKENNIGIYIDAANADSNGEYYMNLFEGNNVAIQFHDVGTRAMTSYELVQNRFIDNTVDIKNEITTKVLFAPGNYFGTRNEDHSVTARLCYVSGLAYCYPQAADDACSSYQYSFAWYVAEALKISETYETIVVSNETAGSYLIPKDDLTEDTSITVKKEDGTTTGRFDFNNKGGARA